MFLALFRQHLVSSAPDQGERHSGRVRKRRFNATAPLTVIKLLTFAFKNIMILAL